MTTVSLVRGDTFSYDVTYTNDAGTPVDLTGNTVASQVRRLPGRELVGALSVALGNQTTAPGTLTLTALPAATATWPLGTLVCDVRFTDAGGVVAHGPAFAISVTAAVTE